MWFLKLASTTLDQPGINGFSIDVSTGAEHPRVAFAEGVGYHNHAAVVSIAEALTPTWRRPFAESDGMWLLPHLERAAAGQPLDEGAIVNEFVERHGREPQRYEWPGVEDAPPLTS